MGVYGGGGAFRFCGGVVIRLGTEADSREELSVGRLGGGAILSCLAEETCSRDGGGVIGLLAVETCSREATCSRPLGS
jgi:hypothetical protein